MARHWPLDPAVTYLNHGAYGACPWPVLHDQSEWRARLERQPTLFMGTQLDALMHGVRGRLGDFLHADADDLALLPNATTGINTVLASIDFDPGDEILTTDHEYNAIRNACLKAAARAGAQVIVARLPFPIQAPGDAHDAILERVSPRTRMAVISHVTSPTGLVLPIAQIVAALAERGIDTLVDGAHAPGMVDIDLGTLGAAYYAGNCHKWLCAPKGSGFLHVRRDRQAVIHPLVTSHGANSPRRDRTRFRLEFDWTGTFDPTPWLALPAAIEFVGGLMPEGWQDAMRANRSLALEGRRRLLGALGQAELPAPEEMIASLTAVELPADLAPAPTDPAPAAEPDATYPLDPLHEALLSDHAIEVPVYSWPHTPADCGRRRRLLRVSAQLYNSPDDYDRLAMALSDRC